MATSASFSSEVNGHSRRPSTGKRSPTAPPVMSTMNGNFASVGSTPTAADFEHGVQVIDGDKNFNPALPAYLQLENVVRGLW